MRDVMLVAAGGAVGSAARYLVTLLLGAAPGRPPLGTLVVNVVGCLCIGLFMGAAGPRGWLGPARLLVVTGVLGGFTTFSAFGWETYALAADRAHAAALHNVLLQVVLGLAAVWLGARLAAAF